MHVAVKRKFVRDFDNDADINHHDCFPETLSLACKSARKNEFEPSFKAILKQEVLLNVDGRDVNLMLLGANLDTDDESRLGQLQALERMLNVCRRGSQNFAAIMWGDFNNRLVAFDGMKDYVTESKKGGYELTDSGSRFLVESFADPVKRLELLKKDSLFYGGPDISGKTCEIPKSHQQLLRLFHMAAEVVLGDTNNLLSLPLPTYKHTPLEVVLSQAFKHRLRIEEVVCSDSLAPVDVEMLMHDPTCTYFGTDHQVPYDIAEGDVGANLYLNCGWPDGVGIYERGTIPARIEAWQCEWGVRAYQHLPMRSVVSLELEPGRSLKAWLGFVKLNKKFPTFDSLRKLLYSDLSCSAHGCEVVALYLTDAFIAPDEVNEFRSLLQKCLETSELGTYVFNEDDPSLLIRQIPAQLVKGVDDGFRYVSMHVAVKRKFVRDFDNDADINHHDCFPETLSLACKSARKNEFEPSFKAILKQEVLLNVDGRDVNLMLLGANLDTDDESRLGQLQALERMLNVCRRGSQNFAAIMWGDFNNRLVAFDGMKDYVTESKKGGYELTDSGSRFLVESFADPVKRLELLKKDSLTFSGHDLRGRAYELPACNVKLKELFRLTIDEALNAAIVLPWPFYRVQPFEAMLGAQLGCRLRLLDLVCFTRLVDIQQDFLSKLPYPSSANSSEEHAKLLSSYFNWKEGGKWLQRKLRSESATAGENWFFQFGWLDSVGWYKESSVQVDLLSWESVPTIQAYDHLPMRARMQVTV